MRKSLSFFGESRALVFGRGSPRSAEYITSIERDAFPAGGRGTLHSRRRNAKRKPDVIADFDEYFSEDPDGARRGAHRQGLARQITSGRVLVMGQVESNTISFFGESRALASVRARLSPERREYITSIERDAFPAGGCGTLHSR